MKERRKEKALSIYYSLQYRISLRVFNKQRTVSQEKTASGPGD